MRGYGNKKKGNSILYSWPVLVVFAVILLFFAWGVLRFVVKMRDTEKNKRIAALKVEELTKSKEKLSADIESLKTDKGVEANIREKFGFAKEGEELIVVVEDRNTAKKEPEQEKSWFMLMVDRWFR